MAITINAGPTIRAHHLGEAIIKTFDDLYFVKMDMEVGIEDLESDAETSVVMDITGTVTQELGAELIIRAMTITGPYSKGMAITLTRPGEDRQANLQQAAQGLSEVKEVHRIIRHLQEAEKAQAHDGKTVHQVRLIKLKTAQARIDRLIEEMEGSA